MVAFRTVRFVQLPVYVGGAERVRWSHAAEREWLDGEQQRVEHELGTVRR